MEVPGVRFFLHAPLSRTHHCPGRDSGALSLWVNHKVELAQQSGQVRSEALQGFFLVFPSGEAFGSVKLVLLQRVYEGLGCYTAGGFLPYA